MNRGRSKIEYPTLRVAENPNFRRYKDTNYYASRQGEIYKVYKDKDRKLSIYLNRGHAYVKVNGKKKNASKLVYECFKGEVPEKHYLIHINKVKTDCSLQNLRLVNNHDLSVYASSLRHKMVLDMNTGIVYRSVKECGKAIGYYPHNVAMYCIGKYTGKNTQMNCRYITEDEALEMTYE